MDLRFDAHLVTPIGAKGGSIKRRTPLECGNAPLLLPRRVRSSTDYDNAYRLRITSDIRQPLSDNPHSFIRLQIFARHEVTGMGKMLERRFVHGKELAVAPEERQTRRRSEAQRESS
ncbi:MAG: hypothetical protein QOI78_2986 [Actinomycetota bacterium]|nr:hypothetical protein [Actinomycetota bacterium]